MTRVTADGTAQVLRFPEPRTTSMPCVVLDGTWRYRAVNAAAAADLGKTANDLLGRVIWDCYPGMRDTAIGRSLEYVMRTREPYMARQGAWQRPDYDLLTDITPDPTGGICIRYRVVARTPAVTKAQQTG